jgi:hypothetical protein
LIVIHEPQVLSKTGRVEGTGVLTFASPCFSKLEMVVGGAHSKKTFQNRPQGLGRQELCRSVVVLPAGNQAEGWRKCMGIEPTYPLIQKVHRI